MSKQIEILQKNSGNYILPLGGSCMETVYHVYVKNTCVYHSLTEEEFKKTWEMLNVMVDLLGNYAKEDLSYECLTKDKEYLNASY